MKDWYRPRGYVHLDWPLSCDEAESLVTSPERVASHGFLPFITYDITEPRFKPALGTVEDKKRPIAFAAHTDAHIFAFYSAMLRELLEDQITERGLGETVLAYRTHQGKKCNIHFADDAFEQIKSLGECDAVAIDVERFFDTLDHSALKSAWAHLLEQRSLSDDHYAVFKAVTKFATIDRDKFYTEFGYGRRARENNRRPICSPREFRRRVRAKGLIEVNRNPFGIPQGSPISAILSNLYMLEADTRIQSIVTSAGGIYRRYCDDILLICRPENRVDLEKAIIGIAAEMKLTINESKTVRSEFRHDRAGLLTSDRPLQYLGFDFDGQRKMIRSKTIARFSRRMVQAVRSAQRASRKSMKSGGPGRIRRRELFDRFSHLGGRNFVRYGYRAAEIMNDDTPRRQLRRFWRRLNLMIRNAEAELGVSSSDI